MLPMIIGLKIIDKEHKINLYIPMVFIYILYIFFVLLFIPIYLIMSLFPNTKTQRNYLIILFKIPEIISAARGTNVTVFSEDTDIKIFIK